MKKIVTINRLIEAAIFLICLGLFLKGCDKMNSSKIDMSDYNIKEVLNQK